MTELNPIPMDYVIIGLGLLFLTILSIWQTKKRKEPSQLNLKAPASLHEGESVENKKQWSKARELNIMIDFQGVKIDAFSVFDLPAGSSIEEVEASYSKKMESGSVAERLLFEKAYKAIKNL